MFGQHSQPIQPQASFRILAVVLPPERSAQTLPQSDQANTWNRYAVRQRSARLPCRRRARLHPPLVRGEKSLRPRKLPPSLGNAEYTHGQHLKMNDRVQPEVVQEAPSDLVRK